VYDPNGFLRVVEDLGGLNCRNNKRDPGGRSEASRAIFDLSGLLCLSPFQRLAKPLFVSSNLTATSISLLHGGLRWTLRNNGLLYDRCTIFIAGSSGSSPATGARHRLRFMPNYKGHVRADPIAQSSAAQTADWNLGTLTFLGDCGTRYGLNLS
jgi:hypothetical protein